ncbi:MAG: hypothetical protein K9L02_03035 [Acholeplasmataceae bacterium]|nr:hypothetical protein [Acholeplasmataceae bacterium]
MDKQKSKYPAIQQQKRHQPLVRNQDYSKNQPKVSPSFFQGNLVKDMKFGGKGHDLSGYVQRTLVVKDRYGNVQIAKEKQFFNSSKRVRRVRINDDEKD